MFYLHMRPEEFGIKGHESVKAAYDSISAAEAQAEHNIERETQTPLRIIDQSGAVLVDYTDEQVLAEIRARIKAQKEKV